MITALYTKHIGGQSDMAELESVLTRAMGGGRAGFTRSEEYVRFRLAALYGIGTGPVEAYGDTLKVTLDQDRMATVYLLGPAYVSDLELGKTNKRSAPDSDDSEPECPDDDAQKRQDDGTHAPRTSAPP